MLRSLACALLLASASFTSAQPAPSPSLAVPAVDEEVARRFVDAVNGAGPGEIDSFISAFLSPRAAEFEPIDQLVRRMRALQAQSGGLDRVEWTSRTDPVRFTGRTRRGGLAVRGLVGVENGRMLGFQIEQDRRVRGPGAPRWPEAAGSQAEALAAIESELEWQADADRFSGSVLILRGGRPVLERSFGLARRGPDVPNRTDTIFHTASTTKMFTAAAVGQLIDAGRLTLDMPLAAAIPALAEAPGAAGTTIRDLLGHRVSYGDYFFTPAYEALEREGATATRLLALVSDRQPRPAREGRISYSNANYLLLAAAVEAVTGTSFYDHLERRIFGPLGMGSTLFGDAGRRPPQAAIGWIKDDVTDPLGIGEWQPNDGRVPLRGGPPGGTWTSAGDLGRFMNALADGKVVSPDTLRAMLADGRPMGRSFDYALGFMRRSANGRTYFGHDGGGGNAGVSTSAFATTDGAWSVVVLSNYSSPAGDDLGRQLIELLLTVPENRLAE